MNIRHLLLALPAIFLPGSARSAWDVHGNPIVAITYGQLSPSIIADGAGGAIMAWQDQHTGPGSDDICVP